MKEVDNGRSCCPLLKNETGCSAPRQQRQLAKTGALFFPGNYAVFPADENNDCGLMKKMTESRFVKFKYPDFSRIFGIFFAKVGFFVVSKICDD